MTEACKYCATVWWRLEDAERCCSPKQIDWEVIWEEE